jgi:hypothetical protein
MPYPLDRRQNVIAQPGREIRTAPITEVKK